MHAKNRVRENQFKGGVARARALPPAARSEIAKRAALSRWDTTIQQVEYGGKDPLKLGDIELDCYVLSDGTRAFSQRGINAALGLAIRGGELQKFIDQASLKGYLSDEAIATLDSPIPFWPPGGGRFALGFMVTVLIDLCTAILDSAKAGNLPRHFEEAKIRAEVIVRAVAKVGIIALVDEVTGYDEHRKERLEALLDRYLRKELAAWSKRFPDEFYEQIFRLRRWPWRGRAINPPSAVAHYTKDLVYARIVPGVLKELENRNPIVESESGKRYRKRKHHQFLTDDVGNPHLQQHLLMVLGIMRASQTWEQMMALMDHALPRMNESVQLPLLDWDATANQYNKDGEMAERFKAPILGFGGVG